MSKEAKARILVFLQFFLLAALLLASHFSQNTTYFPATSILMLFGISVLFIAFINLRSSLRISPIPKENAAFISKGIYKYVRHPMYLGLLSIGMALAANANNGLGWILFVLIMIVLNVKANFEDALLREMHPESVHYQLHTSKIIPCLGGSCRDNCTLQ